MNEVAPLINDLALMLGLAAVVILLFQWIKQPVVLGYLVAGMIIGPHTPPYSLVADEANIQILSELGVIFLMFSLGLEFSFQKLTRVGFSATVIGIIEVLLMISLGYFVGIAIGWSHFNSLFLGAALSISSTTIILKAIEELGLKNKRFAELIFGVLIIEDLLAILLLVALSAMVVSNNVISADMFYATLKLILVVGSWFLVGYFVVPTVFRIIATYLNQETLTILSVALCLFLVCVAASLHYSAALGAFIMGSILAETYAINRIEDLIRPIRDIFAAVFFITVGMIIDPLIILQQWKIVLLLSFVTVFAKILTTSGAALLSGQSLNTSLRTGFSMAQIGEFSFIIVTLGLSLGVVSTKLYPIIVAVSTITTFTTPYLIRLSGRLVGALDRYLPPPVKFVLKAYAGWVFRSLSVSKKNKILRNTLLRFMINGIIVAIIFTLIHYIVFHRLALFSESSHLAKSLFLLLALVCSMPFIWGMLFSHKVAKRSKKHKHYPILTSAIFLIWLLTLTELTVLSVIYFGTWLTILIYVVTFTLFFILTYRQIERSYRWFEKQLVRNIKAMDAIEKKFEELAPWDTHLVEIEVAEHSRFVGKEIAENNIRNHYGVNIVAITHGSRTIAAPRGTEKIHAHDRLIVLGNDEQIDAFRKDIEIIESKPEPISVLNNFVLRAVFLESQHPFVGSTIRNSKIRETINGLIVGLERNNTRILNPAPDMVLKEGDLLLIVGELVKLNKIKH